MWKELARILGRMLQAEEIEWLYFEGGMSMQQRQKQVDDFHSNPAIKVMVCFCIPWRDPGLLTLMIRARWPRWAAADRASTSPVPTGSSLWIPGTTRPWSARQRVGCTV